ncbi:MAG: hypothetical protein ISS33_02590 [Candidatus Omnitrophica bacterium]|nr:hypothetical protein [Candidatus Omnitrophota bacterium]
MKKLFSVFIVFTVLCVFSSGSFAQSTTKVIVYYFHTTFRCSSCHKIEQYTEGALREYFEKEIESGDLAYREINVEDKENQHFVKDYQIYTKSVVLSLSEGGKEIKFKNLEKVWQYLGNRDKFYEYIKGETQSFLDVLKTGDGS